MKYSSRGNGAIPVLATRRLNRFTYDRVHATTANGKLLRTRTVTALFSKIIPVEYAVVYVFAQAICYLFELFELRFAFKVLFAIFPRELA